MNIPKELVEQWKNEYLNGSHEAFMAEYIAQRAAEWALSNVSMEQCGWIRACDKEMVDAHLGVANLSDSYESAKAKLASLIEWHVAVATDPAVNGGLSLQPEPVSMEPVAWRDKHNKFDLYVSNINQLDAEPLYTAAQLAAARKQGAEEERARLNLVIDKARAEQEAHEDQALRERDEYHEVADDLAAQIAAITGEDIGEHSSANNPWHNAMLAADDFIAGQIKEVLNEQQVRPKVDAVGGRQPSEGVVASGRMLVSSIDSLLELDAEGVLAPHGIGGHARTLLEAAATRIKELERVASVFDQVTKE